MPIDLYGHVPPTIVTCIVGGFRQCPGNNRVLIVFCSNSFVKPLVLLLSTFIEKNPQEAQKKIEPLLGVFQKLIASRSNDTHGFSLLKAMTCYLSPKELEKYWQSIFLGKLTVLVMNINFQLKFCSNAYNKQKQPNTVVVLSSTCRALLPSMVRKTCAILPTKYRLVSR